MEMKVMTSTSINNGNAQRKQLSSQLDRLDQILDGLSDALTESVADAVKEVIGQVVSEAVSLAVKEVLSSPELLRAALHKYEPVQAVPTPKRKTLKDLLRSAGGYVSSKMQQAAGNVKSKLITGWTWCCEKVQKACNATVGACVGLPGTVVKVACGMWTFRKSCVTALVVGVLAGVSSFYAGPLISSIASGISGAALTVSGMILVPLWRLMMGSNGA
jgi:hypothetical protein